MAYCITYCRSTMPGTLEFRNFSRLKQATLTVEFEKDFLIDAIELGTLFPIHVAPFASKNKRLCSELLRCRHYNFRKHVLRKEITPTGTPSYFLVVLLFNSLKNLLAAPHCPDEPLGAL